MALLDTRDSQGTNRRSGMMNIEVVMDRQWPLHVTSRPATAMACKGSNADLVTVVGRHSRIIRPITGTLRRTVPRPIAIADRRWRITKAITVTGRPIFPAIADRIITLIISHRGVDIDLPLGANMIVTTWAISNGLATMATAGPLPRDTGLAPSVANFPRTIKT